MARPDGASMTADSFLPDGKRVLFTSTRDNTNLAIGSWSDQNNYPQGAELYISDIDGGNRKRLTNNAHYDAEVSDSPDGMKIVFSRQVDGAMDLYMMNSDGTGETKLTDTLDWQEGAPFFLRIPRPSPRAPGAARAMGRTG